MDVQAKAFTFNKNVSIVRSETGPVRSFVATKFMDGRVRNLPEHQIPASDPYELANIWRYPAQGQYTAALINGSQVQFRINEGTGTGKIEAIYLRMIVQNNSSTHYCQYLPAPFWLKGWNWQNPNGEIIQYGDGTLLWLQGASAHDSEHWPFVAQMINSSPQYGLADEIAPSEMVEIQIELKGNWLQTGNIENPWIKGDQFFYATFQPDAVTRVYPAILTGQLNIIDMSLDMHMPNTDQKTIQNRAQLIKSMQVDSVFPYYRNQSFNMALQANSSYTLLLNGLSGDVVFIWILLRNSYIGTDLFNCLPISSFQFLDSGGNPITSQNLITDVMNRDIFFPRHFLGQLAQYQNIYHWNFASQDTAPLSMIELGLKLGSYPFTGNEKLVLNTAPAGNNEVLNLAFTVPATQTGAGQTPTASPPTVGGFYFLFTTPNGGQNQSALVQANATNTDVQNIIEAMPNFSGSVTVTGFPLAFTGTASGIGNAGISATATITFGGDYALQPLASEGFSLITHWAGMQTEITNGAVDYLAPVVIGTTTNPAGVAGIQNGNTYYIDIYAVTSAIATITKEGYVRAQYAG